jgi:hypothetical protein
MESLETMVLLDPSVAPVFEHLNRADYIPLDIPGWRDDSGSTTCIQE